MKNIKKATNTKEDGTQLHIKLLLICSHSHGFFYEEAAKLFIPVEKNRFFIPQVFKSRIKKKMQKEGVIAADKDLRGEHGCCLGHCNSVFHLLQVNQKLIKCLLSRVWRPDRSRPHCSRQEGSAYVADTVPPRADPLNTDTSQPSHKGKI